MMLLPQVVISKIPSHVKLTKVDKTPDTTLHTVSITPPNTPSKPLIHNIMSKRPISNTEKANFKRIRRGGYLQFSWWNRWCSTPYSWFKLTMKIAINKQDVTEYLLHAHISWHISVVHCSIVLRMTIVAGYKVY